MRIAIPTTKGLLSSHFGHCEKFYVVDVENGQLSNEQMIVPPAHEPGLYPKWVKEQGVDLVIGGGMGQKAQVLFHQNQVEIIVGASNSEPRGIVESYVAGTLETGSNHCDH